jgi:hypothetical protein
MDVRVEEPFRDPGEQRRCYETLIEAVGRHIDVDEQ